MVGPKKTLFMDKTSIGLDSSTTFQIVKGMGDFVHLREGTVHVPSAACTRGVQPL